MLKNFFFIVLAGLNSANIVLGQNGKTSTVDKTDNPSLQDGSGSLGQIYNISACGLNYVQASVMTTTRYFQPGTGFPATLAISGLPPCYVIDKAYVWYIASYQSPTAPATTVNITNPAMVLSNIAATNIGQGGSKCWGETGTAVYRADVTSAISGNGNYVINLSGFSNLNWEVDGVTLFIIYKNPTVLYKGTLIINDGNITSSTGNLSTQTMLNVNACAASTAASAFNIVSDMQNNVGPSHPAMLNGVTANYPNNFWCFDQSATTVTNAQTTANYSEDGQMTDCYTWAVMGLYYRTTTCTTCTVPPSSVVAQTQVVNNATCNQSNGSASASATGGTPPYTYSWSTTPVQTTQTATGLPAGTYTVYVSDNTGCNTGTATITITNTNGVTLTTTQNNIQCNGQNNGSATANPTGQSPFTYSWNTTPAQTSATATGLAPGTYTVIVTDANGCTASITVTITQPTAMSGTVTTTNVTCNGGNNGTATVTITGGTGPYTYLWNPGGQTTPTRTGLTAGTYTVLVTDANGCTRQQLVTITQPQPINIIKTQVNVSCNGGNNGSATASASGGTAPYTYAWNTTPPQNTATATGLSSGTYIVTVIDANSCMRLDTVQITQPPPPQDTLAIKATFCDGDSVAMLRGPAGLGPYQWYNNTIGIPNATTDSLKINPALINNYTVTWYFNGCRRKSSAKVITTPVPFFLPDSTVNVFTPNGDGQNDIFYPYRSKYYNSSSIEYYGKNFSMKIYDRWGVLVYETTSYMPEWNGQTNGKDASAGVYYWISSYVSRCSPNSAPVINKGYVHLLR